MVSKKKFLTQAKSSKKTPAPMEVFEIADDNPESLLLCGVCPYPLLDTLGSTMMQKPLSCKPPSSPFQVEDNGSPQSMVSSGTDSSSSFRRNRSQACPQFTLALPTENNSKRSYDTGASNDTDSSSSSSPKGNSLLAAACTSSIPTMLRTCLHVSSPVEEDDMRSLHAMLSHETTSPRLPNRFRSKMSFFKFKIPVPKNPRSATLMDESSGSEFSSKDSQEERDDQECSSEDEQDRQPPRSRIPIKIKAPKPLNPWTVVKTLNIIKNKAPPTLPSDGSTIVSSEMEEGGDVVVGRDNWAGGDQDDSILFRQCGPPKAADIGPSLPGSDIDDSEILSDQENQHIRSNIFAPRRRTNDALLDAASQLLHKQKMLWVNMTK